MKEIEGIETGKEYIFQPVCPSCGNLLNHTNYQDIFYCPKENKGFVLLPLKGEKYSFGILRDTDKLGINLVVSKEK